MDSDLYQEQLQEAARDPRWRGVLPPPAETLQRYNASCGDQIQVWAQWSPEGSLLERVRWEGSGCLMSQAAATRMAAWAEGKSRPAILAADLATILKELNLTTIGPGRVRCVWLFLRTLQELAEHGTLESI